MDAQQCRTLLDTGTASIPNPGAGVNLAASLDLDTAAGGVVAAILLAYDNSVRTTTWASLTERYDGTADTIYGGDWFSVADLNAGSASTPLVVTGTTPNNYNTGNPCSISAIAVSLNPAASGVTLTAVAGSYAVTGGAVIENFVMPLGAAGA